MEQWTGFPHELSDISDNRICETPLLVEITSITEIGHSAFNLYNVRQTRIERVDLAGLAEEEGVESDEGPIPNYPRQMLKLELSDGTTTAKAIEYRSIPELKLGETPLGFKVRFVCFGVSAIADRTCKDATEKCACAEGYSFLGTK